MILAEKYKERPEICNAIGAHHEEVEMNTLIAPLVLVADAISGATPLGAINEAVLQHQKYMLTRARELREDLTREERHLWYDYLRYHPVHWYKQRIIEDYIVDFYCPSAKLAVELDGWQHQELDNWYADQVRDRELGELGIQVLRFTNVDVNYRFRRVCAEIKRVMTERQGEDRCRAYQ